MKQSLEKHRNLKTKIYGFKCRKYRKGFKDNLLKSLGYLEIDSLQKGAINYQIISSSAFTIPKTGKLIKEKLSVIKVLALQKISEDQNSLQLLRNQIGIEPLEDSSNYDRLILTPQCLLKTYSWRQRGDSESSIGNSEEFSISLSLPKEKVEIGLGELMSQYNSIVYQYNSYQKDLALIDTMLKNFQDNKSYDLTVEQATSFGF